MKTDKLPLKTVELNSYEDLIKFIEENDFKIDVINQLIQPIFGCFFVLEHPKEEIIQIIKDYIQRYEEGVPRRVLIDVDPLSSYFD
jgi:hypothetical protein